MVYIGIDPGQTGGIATLDDTVSTVRYTSANLIGILKKLKAENKSIKVYVEEVHSMPHQGVRSMFTFGNGYGQILGILEALEVKYELVTPNCWKKYVGVTHDKKTSIVKAQKLFPDVSLLPTSKCRVPDDGLAEALLIAYYGKDSSQSFGGFKTKFKKVGKKNENW